MIDQKLQRLARVAGAGPESGANDDSTIRVVLIAGTGGGTGAGMAIDIANAAQSLAANRGLKVDVQGFLVCTCLANLSSSPLAVANTYSLLMELNHATALGNEGNSGQATQNKPFESRQAPFHRVYCVPIRPRSKNAEAADALDPIAQYLALESTPVARAALRACRASRTPREQSHDQALSLRLFGLSSLADQKSQLVNKLAIGLRDAIKQHWVTKDTSADWERLLRAEQASRVVASPVPTPDGAGGADSVEKPVSNPANEVTPLALRGRFKEHMSLEFTSEIVRQLQQRLEARDDRGKPLILPGDAKLIADSARAVAAFLVPRVELHSDSDSPFASSPVLRPLIAHGGKRVISRAIEKFDMRHAERFLPADALDDLIHAECRSLLDACLASKEHAAEIMKLLDLDRALLSAVENSNADLLQCGSDRRTLVFTPNAAAEDSATKSLSSVRPLAACLPADMDDYIVVSESAGISPRSIACGLERVFPGIADAARRLLTRIDIEWQPLV
jgi:hypothetical protein